MFLVFAAGYERKSLMITLIPRVKRGPSSSQPKSCLAGTSARSF